MPYPGLRAFRRDEADLFFGRDDCVDEMIDRLAESRFLAVLGASGSGKSSIVRTGLLPALALGFNARAGNRWLIAEMHPGDNPIAALATGLLAANGEPFAAVDVDLLAEGLRRGPRAIVEWCLAGHLPAGTNLLIIADQFEEIFRYADYGAREACEAFVNLLLVSAAAPEVPISVVMTMRSEFLAACTLFDGLAERINQGLYLTPRMTRDACQAAIEGPAMACGFVVAPALVNRLLNDMTAFAPWEEGESSGQIERLSRRADQLPLMQHLLNRLWLRALAKGGPILLTEAEYEAIGGLKGALDEHGASIVANLGPGAVDVVETVLRSLVSGSSAELAVRRPTTVGEIVAFSRGDLPTVRRVLDAFRAPDCNFLQPPLAVPLTEATLIDLSHESLIRQWSQLAEWTAKEARSAESWRRLNAATARHEHNEGGLLHGVDLTTVAAWWDAEQPTAVWEKRFGGAYKKAAAFLAESRAASEAAENARIVADQREKRALRRRAAILATLALLTTTSAVGATYAAVEFFDQKKVADHKKKEADDQKRVANLEKHRAQVAERQQRALALTNRDLFEKERVARDRAQFAQQEAERSGKAARTALERYQEEAKRRVLAEEDRTGLNEDILKLSPEIQRSMANYQKQVARAQQQVSKDKGIAVALKTNTGGNTAQGQTVSAGATSNTMAATTPDPTDPISPAVLQSLTEDIRAPVAPSALAVARNGVEQYRDERDRLRPLIEEQKPDPQAITRFIATTNDLASLYSSAGDKAAARTLAPDIEHAISRFDPVSSARAVREAQLKFAFLEFQLAFAEGDADKIAAWDKQSSASSDLVAADPGAGANALGYVFRNMMYLAGKITAPAEQKLAYDRACHVADRIRAMAPDDGNSSRFVARCLWQRAYTANSGGDRSSGLKSFEEVVAMLRREQARKPDDQVIAISLFESLAKLASQYGSEQAVQSQALRKEAAALLFDAFAAKPLKSYVATDNIAYAYDSIVTATFETRDEELRFLQTIARAVAPTATAFPKSGQAYVLADARRRIAAALLRKPATTPDLAEAYYEAASAGFANAGVLADLARNYPKLPHLPGNWSTQDFSETPANVCATDLAIMTFHANRGNATQALAAYSRMMAQCRPALNAYPFDFYLRTSLILADAKIGAMLHQLKRFAEAKPHLEEASKWNNAESTNLLADMYRNGSGVATDAKQADQLDKKAAGQTMKKFTVPTVFSGKKYPFYVYVANWPEEYYSPTGLNLHGILDQALWVLAARGGEVPKDVIESFDKLQKIASENNVSYVDLALYALGAAQADAADVTKGATDAQARVIEQEMRRTQFVRSDRMQSDPVGVAISGYDPVSYRGGTAPTAGSAAIFTLWNGAIWLFSSEEHRRAFLANPARYAPQYGGFCADDIGGKKTQSDPTVFKILRDKLYLFGEKSERDGWDEKSLAAADAGWQREQDNVTKSSNETAIGKRIKAALNSSPFLLPPQ